MNWRTIYENKKHAKIFFIALNLAAFNCGLLLYLFLMGVNFAWYDQLMIFFGGGFIILSAVSNDWYIFKHGYIMWREMIKNASEKPFLKK